MQENNLELLKKLVEFNSIYPNEYEISSFLYNLLLELNFKVEKQYISEKRFNVLAEKGKGDFSYLLYAHTDTVPIYGRWENNPFELIIKDNLAIGLGVVDMKAGIFAILESIKDFEPTNFKLKICFGVDEENFSEGAFSLTKTNFLDDVKGVLIPESCLPHSKSSKAAMFITIGRKGRAVFLIKIKGKSAHGVEKNRGINSIEEGIKLLNILKTKSFSQNPNMGKTDFFVRKFEGKTDSFSIPDYAEIELDFQLVTPDTSKSIKEKIEKIILTLKEKKELKADFEVTFSDRPTPFLEPFEVSKNNDFLSIATKAMKEVYNEVFFNYSDSVADENVFGALNIPVLTIGPLGDNHHSANEWVEINSIFSLIEVYKRILNSWLQPTV
ncbi:MAG: M20/M25/M40 family metallo-hydrolase [Candidatus Sericytochromatia bacterium]